MPIHFRAYRDHKAVTACGAVAVFSDLRDVFKPAEVAVVDCPACLEMLTDPKIIEQSQARPAPPAAPPPAPRSRRR